jgi:hypothetical protein
MRVNSHSWWSSAVKLPKLAFSSISAEAWHKRSTLKDAPPSHRIRWGSSGDLLLWNLSVVGFTLSVNCHDATAHTRQLLSPEALTHGIM